MLGRTTLEVEGMTAAIADATAYIQGKRRLPPSGAELADQVEQLLTEAAEALKDAEGPKERVRAMHAYAVARDAANAMAGRLFVKSLAAHNNMRDIYENGKQAVITAPSD